MPVAVTYVAFLRGINIGGKRNISMAKLKEAMTKCTEFTSVASYINSGNILFKSSSKDAHALERKVESVVAESFGFDDVPVMVRSLEDIRGIIKQKPMKEEVNAKLMTLTHIVSISFLFSGICLPCPACG